LEVGFKVSHTKDGIRWDETEDEFIAALKAALSTSDLPILDQAHNWRSSDSGDVPCSTEARCPSLHIWHTTYRPISRL
jgi:hypothetical protein